MLGRKAKRPAIVGRFFIPGGGMFYPGGTAEKTGPILYPPERPWRKRPTVATNPRWANRSLRIKYQSRFRAMNAECGICHGRLGEIHYDEPSDSKHPLSFVIDEIKPVSRYREFGYDSARQAAEDWANLQAAHYCCNAAKSNKVLGERQKIIVKTGVPLDGDW